MAINVTIGESKPQEKPFPKLMLKKGSGGIVYLFHSKFECTIIANGSIGKTYKENYDLTIYCEDYNEPITLQNQ